MESDKIELAERAVACKGFRRVPGMRCVRNDGLSYVVVCAVSASKVEPTWLPDVTDAATLGCLLALVREAWGDPFLCPAADRETGWWLNGYAAVDYLQSYRSEAEALVAALEAAP